MSDKDFFEMMTGPIVRASEHDHAYDNVIEDQEVIPLSSDPTNLAVQYSYHYEKCGCPAPKPETDQEFYADLDTGWE